MLLSYLFLSWACKHTFNSILRNLWWQDAQQIYTLGESSFEKVWLSESLELGVSGLGKISNNALISLLGQHWDVFYLSRHI